MGKLEVQSVKFVPPEWYDNRERFEKKAKIMFDEITEFVKETRETISEQNKQISAVESRRVRDIDNTVQMLQTLRENIQTLSGRFDEFMVSHEQRHEDETGILKKIFGKVTK